MCGQRVFHFLMCCRQSLLSFRLPGNLNPRKGGTARSLRILSLIVGAESFTEAMKIGCETYHTLKNVIKKKYGLDGK